MFSFRSAFGLLRSALLAASVLAITASFASANGEPEESQDSSQGQSDLVVEQNSETQAGQRKVVVKVKGDRMRMDYAEGTSGGVTVLWDVKTGDYRALMHEQKLVMKMSIANVTEQVKAQEKASGIDADKIEKPKATGKTEKVGMWETEIFETKVGKDTVRLWVAKGLPNYRSVQVRMQKFNGFKGGLARKAFDLGGLVVKTEMKDVTGGTNTTTVLRFREERIPDSEFEVPGDYREQGN